MVRCLLRWELQRQLEAWYACEDVKVRVATHGSRCVLNSTGLSKAGGSINLKIGFYRNLTNCMSGYGFFIQNIVVGRSIEKVDYWPTRVGWNTISIFGLKDMAVGL